jgi:hypothetical protein
MDERMDDAWQTLQNQVGWGFEKGVQNPAGSTSKQLSSG